MLYRRYDFTNPEVLEVLKNFIPVAVEHRSWQDSLPDREKYFPGFIDRSGMHVYEPEAGHGANLLVGLFGLRPDGTLIKKGRTNTEGPATKTETLEYFYELLALWNETPEAQRGFPGLDREFPRPENHWGPAAMVPPMPHNKLVLKSFTRDLPREGETLSDEGLIRRKDYFNDIYNSDFILIDNPGSLVPRAPVVGSVYEWPKWLTTRLVRFHLVDNVAGLTIAFPKKAIERAEIFSKVTAVTAHTVDLEFTGVTRAVTRGDWGLSQTKLGRVVERGFETELRGNARWLPVEQRFEEFSVTAVGTRWGGTPQNRRAEVEFPPHTNDLDGGPIGVHFQLFDGPEQDVVAPFFAWNRRGDPGDYWEREIR